MNIAPSILFANAACRLLYKIYKRKFFAVSYSVYYQAHIKRELCWYFVAILRSSEHLAFDRTLNKHTSLFEFFVPADMEQQFLIFMQEFEKQQIVTGLQKLPNRLSNHDESVWLAPAASVEQDLFL